MIKRINRGLILSVLTLAALIVYLVYLGTTVQVDSKVEKTCNEFFMHEAEARSVKSENVDERDRMIDDAVKEYVYDSNTMNALKYFMTNKQSNIKKYEVKSVIVSDYSYTGENAKVTCRIKYSLTYIDDSVRESEESYVSVKLKYLGGSWKILTYDIDIRDIGSGYAYDDEKYKY